MKFFFCKLRDALGFHITPTTEQPKGRCVCALGLRSWAPGTSFAEKTARRNVAPERWAFLAGTGGGCPGTVQGWDLFRGWSREGYTPCIPLCVQPSAHRGTYTRWRSGPLAAYGGDRIVVTLHRLNDSHTTPALCRKTPLCHFRGRRQKCGGTGHVGGSHWPRFPCQTKHTLRGQ